MLEPELPKAKRELDPDLVEKEEDYLSYAIFPDIALKFFQLEEEPGVRRRGTPAEADGAARAHVPGRRAPSTTWPRALSSVVSEGVSQALQSLTITVSLGGAGQGEAIGIASPGAAGRWGAAAAAERG